MPRRVPQTAVLLALLAAACSQPDLADRTWSCATDGDCLAGYRCRSGLCRREGGSFDALPETADGPRDTAESGDCHVGACAPADGGGDAGPNEIPEQVRVEGGTFALGSPAGEDGRQADEAPFEVAVGAFLVDRTEATNAQYLACVRAPGGPCQAPLRCSDGLAAWNPSGDSYPVELAAHPVRCLTWDMADSYCRWAGKRLCTEAEWERACVGDAHRAFPWGPEWPAAIERHANCDDATCHDGSERSPGGSDSPPRTTAVGAFPDGATPGTDLVDLAGNVSEWVSSCYGARYADDTPSEPRGPCADEPSCARCGGVQIHRGGGYDGLRETLRCARRLQALENAEVPPRSVGVRCCRDAQEPAAGDAGP